MVFIQSSQFSELQEFFKEQCHLDVSTSDCYTAAMGERGFTLLHLIQKLSARQERTGQWHEELEFIATYHRAAVSEGFAQVLQGHTAPSLYVSSDLEELQSLVLESSRPPAPANSMFESPQSVQGATTRACLDPEVRDLTNAFDELGDVSQSPPPGEHILNPFPSPHADAVLVMVHVNSVPSTHYVWMFPDGSMINRHGRRFQDLDDFQRSIWPTTVSATELVQAIDANADCFKTTSTSVRLMPVIAIANAFRKVLSLKNRFWFDSCASSSISFDPSDFVSLRRTLSPIQVTVATGPDAEINFIGDIILEFRDGNQDDPDEVYRVQHENVLWYPLAHSKLLCAKKVVRSMASSQPGASAKFVMMAISENEVIEEGYVQVESDNTSRRFQLEYLGPEDNECPASNATCVVDPIFEGYHSKTPDQQRDCVAAMLAFTAAKEAEEDGTVTCASIAIVEPSPTKEIVDNDFDWPPTPTASEIASVHNLTTDSSIDVGEATEQSTELDSQFLDAVTTYDGKYQFRKVPYGSSVSQKQHFDQQMVLGKRTEKPLVSLRAASTDVHDSSKYDGHSTVRAGHNPILDHEAVTKDKVAYVEQVIPMMENQYRWQRPQPGEFPISVPTTKHADLYTAGLESDSARQAEMKALPPEHRQHAEACQAQSKEFCEKIDAIMASDGGKLGKVRPAAKSVVRVEKTPPLLPQPFSVPYAAQAKLKQASPDAEFTETLKQTPVKASKKFSYDDIHVEQRANAMLDASSPSQSEDSPFSAPSTPAWMTTVPNSESDSDSCSGCDSVSPATRINAVAVSLEDVQVIHLSHDKDSHLRLCPGYKKGFTLHFQCNSAPKTEAVLQYVNSICNLVTSNDRMPLPPTLVSHSYQLKNARKIAFERLWKTSTLVRRMSIEAGAQPPPVPPANTVLPRAMYVFNMPTEWGYELIQEYRCFLGPRTILYTQQLPVLRGRVSLPSHNPLNLANVLQSWPIKYVNFALTSITDHFYLTEVDGTIQLRCAHDMSYREANKWSMALRFFSPIRITMADRNSMPLCYRKWTVEISQREVIDESHWRSVASLARKVIKEVDAEASWRIMRTGRIGPKPDRTFKADDEIVIDISNSHYVPTPVSSTVTAQLQSKKSKDTADVGGGISKKQPRTKVMAAPAQVLGMPTTNKALYSKCPTLLDLFHLRLSHRSHAHIVKHWALYFPGIPVCTVMHLCAACLSSRAVAKPVAHRTRRKKYVGFFSADVCILKSCPSFSGDQYVYRFLEAASQVSYHSVTAARDAATTMSVVRQLQRRVKDDGYTILHMKSDRGELADEQVQDMLANEVGSSIELGSADSPNSNAQMEHKHFVIQGCARACIVHASLKREFWPSAEEDTELTFNHTVSTVLEKKKLSDPDTETIPMRELKRLVEKQGGQMPMYINEIPLKRVFGCICYAYIVDKKKRNGKYFRVSNMSISLGRVKGTIDGYKLLNLVTGHSNVGRHVFHDEFNLSLQLNHTDRQLLTKVFSAPALRHKLQFRKPTNEEVVSGEFDTELTPLHFIHTNKNGSKQIHKLTVLEALQQHIAIEAGDNSSSQLSSDFGHVIGVAGEVYEDADEVARDVGSLKDPTRSAVQSDALASKTPYCDEDILTVNEARFKRIQSDYIAKRVRQSNGLTVAEIKKLKVLDASGNMVPYMAKDIRYDVNAGSFDVHRSAHIQNIPKILAAIASAGTSGGKVFENKSTPLSDQGDFKFCTVSAGNARTDGSKSSHGGIEVHGESSHEKIEKIGDPRPTTQITHVCSNQLVTAKTGMRVYTNTPTRVHRAPSGQEPCLPSGCTLPQRILNCTAEDARQNACTHDSTGGLKTTVPQSGIGSNIRGDCTAEDVLSTSLPIARPNAYTHDSTGGIETTVPQSGIGSNIRGDSRKVYSSMVAAEDAHNRNVFDGDVFGPRAGSYEHVSALYAAQQDDFDTQFSISNNSDTIFSHAFLKSMMMKAFTSEKTMLPPRGVIPRNRAGIDLMPEPWRSDWEMSFYSEQHSQLTTNSFDFIPVYSCRNAMTYNVRKNVVVYKEKLLPNVNGRARLDKTKTREAFFGTQQAVGIDVIPGSAPTLDQPTARFILCYQRAHGFGTCKFDVPTAYLQAQLECAETMISYPGDSKNKYSHGLDEFTYRDSKGNVYVRYYRTAVYGGKSSAYLWYQKIKIFLVHDLGFVDSLIINGLFMYLTADGEAIILGLFVDDGICLYNSAPLIHWFAKRMYAKFGTKFFGEVNAFLGQDIVLDEQEDTTTITMKSYLEQSDEKYKLSAYNRIAVPIYDSLCVQEGSKDKFSAVYHEQLGVYAWAVNNCYPSHAFALNQLQHVMHAPSSQHHAELRKAHACLYQMRHAGITFHGPRSTFWRGEVQISRTDTSSANSKLATSAEKSKSSAKSSKTVEVSVALVDPPEPNDLMANTVAMDANYGGNKEKEKPQICQVQFACGAAWCWKSCKSAVYCDSTGESELVAAHLASQYSIASRKMSDEFRIPPRISMLYGDNQAAQKICHRAHSSRVERFMRTRADHIKGVVQDKLVYLRDISSATNPSDLGTKAITAPDVWRYLAAVLHGKIRLGLPRSDFSTSELRRLMETSEYHSMFPNLPSRPQSSRSFSTKRPCPTGVKDTLK
jgi:hypothetical protein